MSIALSRVVVFVVILSTQIAVSSLSYLVSGVVVDSDGIAVPNSFVQAMRRSPPNSGGTVGSLNWVRTDENGRFAIKLSSGIYKLAAKNESKGYPDPVFMLNRDPTARFPEVSLVDQDIPNVVIMLGAKGAILEGTILDQQSQKGIAEAKVTIRDARSSDAYVEVFTDGSGHFQFTVPTRPLVISATATGHQNKAFDLGKELTLSAGEHRTITMHLPHD